MNEKPSYDELAARVHELERDRAAHRLRTAALEESVARYSDLIDNASDLIHSVTPEGSFLFVNQAWRDALGYSDSELEHLKLMDIVDEDCRKKCRSIFNCLLQGERLDRNETVFVAKDGKKIVVEGRCSTKFEDGRPVAMVGIFRDISERKRNEQALRESEQRYRNLFENAHDLIQIVRPDGYLQYVNRAWRQTFGYSEEEIAGLSIFDLISPDCREHCLETFKRVISIENVHYIDTVFVAKDGRKIIIEGNACCKFQDGKPVSTQCIFRDVTEKKKMEEELLKGQKLESVGVFAGGIAHDFNNLLTAILGNISLAKMYLSPEDEVYKRLEMTEKASLQAKGLTQQLLTFSKGGAPIKKKTTITELIKDSTSFILRGANVRSEYHLAENLWPIEVDAGQLSQVTQNLVINAAQAMPSGGTVTIRADNVELGDHNPLTLPAGRYVAISFTDEGSGIRKENLSRIFDPYFSSKRTGSGLGLAIAYSVIKKHDGMITVDSEEGRGATFTIYLPATDNVAPVQQQAEETRRPTVQGRVMIMDDEEIVREIAAEMLGYMGCESEGVRDGSEAIALYLQARAEGRPFDVVLMDLTIAGGMGGKETIQKLLELDPQVKAVVSSGYANDPIMANFTAYGFCGVVPKPYKMHELSAALNKILAPRKNEGARSCGNSINSHEP
ncbi:MAG: PAS domain S-box protein [Deltaproteobacteria bacterium]|nr:PAS domain S-box protein [Deltaproteobacteria bacterium]